MKSLFKILFISLSVFALFTCKKYPEGGFVNQTRKHLFGGHNAGDSKTWKLKLYEVNGIDSTYLIQGASNIPDFYNKFVTFKYNNATPSIEYVANTYTQNYTGTISKTEKSILIAYDWNNHEDSSQCKSIDNKVYCQRNILVPEYLNRNPEWKIEKLSKKEFIISIQLLNSYKIILTQ